MVPVGVHRGLVVSYFGYKTGAPALMRVPKAVPSYYLSTKWTLLLVWHSFGCEPLLFRYKTSFSVVPVHCNKLLQGYKAGTSTGKRKQLHRQKKVTSTGRRLARLQAVTPTTLVVDKKKKKFPWPLSLIEGVVYTESLSVTEQLCWKCDLTCC